MGKKRTKKRGKRQGGGGGGALSGLRGGFKSVVGQRTGGRKKASPASTLLTYVLLVAAIGLLIYRLAR